jgi:hypothetical protein
VSPLHDKNPAVVIFDDHLAKWAIGLTFLLLTVNWIAAIGHLQVNVLYWDQWVFFTPIMEGKARGKSSIGSTDHTARVSPSY